MMMASKHKASARAQQRIAALRTAQLEALLALVELLGARDAYPRWARCALAGEEPPAAARTEFKRLCKRAWPKVSWQTREHLRTVARRLGVIPPPEPARAGPAQRPPMRRTRWPRPAYRPEREGAQESPTEGPAEQPDPNPAANDAILNAEHVWQPAGSISEALCSLREDIGWS